MPSSPKRSCWPAWLLALAAALPLAAPAAPRATLHAYASEDEFKAALARWQERAQALQQERRRASDMALQAAPTGTTAYPASNAVYPSSAPPAPAKMDKAAAESSALAGPAAAADSITNVQTAGVDEGGIVKRAGEHLVILRRGRLFTVRVGGDSLAPVAAVDAFGPGVDPQGAWYDELLVSGNTVVVVGYSYARGGTEIGLFELQRDGRLQYRSTWHLRSFDYYSSRNYASRLVGSKLVFYTPSQLQPWGRITPQSLPGLREWKGGQGGQGQATPAEFQPILPATRIYRVDDEFDPAEPLTLHTVTSCDLASNPNTREMRCESTAALGPAGRVFYVSNGAVYVWTNTLPRWRSAALRPLPDRQRARSAVFRLPLDGTAPSALKTAGVPIDQMSFLEDHSGHLNVLLRENGAGEGMWGSEHSRGGMALLRVPLSALGDGQQAAERQHYLPLPDAPAGTVQNRYVGDWLLWGSGQQAWALRYGDANTAPQALSPGHAIERIEALGAHAVLVGNRGSDLHMSAVRLSGPQAEPAGHHVQAGSRQGETRSHGFFYRPTGDEDGLLGLPVLQAGGSNGRSAPGSASVMFLRTQALDFQPLGALQARSDSAMNDGCRASCVDWYGNARPIFMGERVFALMGYELVEGRLERGGWVGVGRERLAERRRINFGAIASRGWEDR
jgi:hypothetical protein